MANIVYNHLAVTSGAEELLPLTHFIGATLDFESMPQHLKALDEETIRSARDADRKPIDDWIREHWGASWLSREIVTTAIEGEGEHQERVEANYNFCTKWMDARPAIKRLSALFPTLTLSYSWDVKFPEMMTSHEHRIIARESRSRCEPCRNKVIPGTFETFAGYAWHFCEEHKTAWCGEKHWGDDHDPAELFEFCKRFGDVTLASLSHLWLTIEPGAYQTWDDDLLRGTLVHLLEEYELPVAGPIPDAVAMLGSAQFKGN
jgi:hypothetical protein